MIQFDYFFEIGWNHQLVKMICLKVCNRDMDSGLLSGHWGDPFFSAFFSTFLGNYFPVLSGGTASKQAKQASKASKQSK